MKARVGCLVLGLGRMGARHAETVYRYGALAAVADPRPEVAKALGTHYGVPSYTDPDRAMAQSGAQAVVIAAATGSHVALVRQAIKYRLAIFCEKPLAPTLDEAEALAKDVETSRLPFQLGFVRRYDPAFVAAKERIARGDIGRPLIYRAIDRDKMAPDPGFLRHSGGIFRDMGVHDFDAARFLMDDEIEAVSVFGIGDVPPYREVGDAQEAVLSLRFESGALGSVILGRQAAFGFDLRVEVLGQEGALFIGQQGEVGLVSLSSGEQRAATYGDYWQRLEPAFRSEIRAFLQGVERGVALIPGAADGVAASAAAEMATRAWQSGPTAYARS